MLAHRPYLIVSLAILLSACTVLDPGPEAAVGRSVDELPTDPSKLTGAELFANYCTVCHNADGSPVDSATIPDLRNYQGSFEAMDSALNRGPGAMPIFTYEQLDSVSRRKIYDVVRSFR